MDYYERMSKVYRLAAIDRDLYDFIDGVASLIAREEVMIPVVQPDNLTGAIILLSVLAFPDEPKKRKHFFCCVSAKLIKMNIPRNSPERKNLKRLTSIPNMKIDQFLGNGKKSAGYRINMRLRAAEVLWLKLGSSNEPRMQDTLKNAAKKVAVYNTSHFPAFFSETWIEGDPVDSFIRRILWTSKPVIHMAMALYSQLIDLRVKDESILGLVLNSDKWLDETMFMAEVIRVEFGSWFPRRDSQYLKDRDQNFSVDLGQTICFLPIIDKLNK